VKETMKGIIEGLGNFAEETAQHAEKALNRYRLIGIDEWNRQNSPPIPDWLKDCEKSALG
jgi:hypothetical protein